MARPVLAFEGVNGLLSKVKKAPVNKCAFKMLRIHFREKKIMSTFQKFPGSFRW